MLYKKNTTARLDCELFKNPTAEYRGTPFWAWNCKLEQKELEWQLEVFKKMGFGGAHMHVRTGMTTPYLGEEYMELVKACVEKAKSQEMLAWLYDEDRYPSGFAGGLVTKEEKFRARYLLFTPIPYGEAGELVKQEGTVQAVRAENGSLLCCYDVELDATGALVSWKVIGEAQEAEHEKWYAYLEQHVARPRYNNQSYVNTLDKAAMDRFIEVTYERYKEAVGEEFDKTIPSIFTDEPQMIHKSTLKYATEKADVILPWTEDLPDTFGAAYPGEDLLKDLPELMWEKADGSVSVLRYHFHEHVCERFTQSFADNCGAWCSENGLELTGHVLNEPTLCSQTEALGEAMRSYRGFGLPGIDMLCANFEYTTAKQTQSAVHQYGREGMLSELYGVTNWDFDFRGHKLHGDWQAALGVTIRVPHLSWVSMEGEAKRDYPASIHYQFPWWEKYALVEDHFARVNTALTRGKPLVKVGVIHPIESYWLHWGPAEQTALVRNNMDDNFQNLTKWLLFGGIDFDFISEALFPELCTDTAVPLKVGAMEYDVILVPGCETLRSTTLERLVGFVEAGGRVLFAGDIPTLEDARPSDRAVKLAGMCTKEGGAAQKAEECVGGDCATVADKAECVQFNQGALLEALEPVRLVELRNETGALTDNLLYNLRQDGEGRWLFIAHGTEPYNKDISRYQDLRIKVEGCWKVTLYNTMNGETEEIEQKLVGDATEIYRRLYDYDSLLLWLEPMDVADEKDTELAGVSSCKVKGDDGEKARILPLPATVPYTLSEPNALLLDQAEYALNDGEWNAVEEILRLDDKCRVHIGWPSRKVAVAQPWVIPEAPIVNTVHLRFRIQSEIDCEDIKLAMEKVERVKLRWNGEPVGSTVTGWYVDKSIKTIALPPLKTGENVLEADVLFGERSGVEWCYLLGDFGVEVIGRHTRIVAARKELTFGNIAVQGLPFYGGNLTYHIPIETAGGEIKVRSSRYRSAMQEVRLDGGKEIPVIYPPYQAALGTPAPGKHTVSITLYGHRRNGFGPIHMSDIRDTWIGPKAWRTEGELWTYDYMVCEEGVLNTPVITEG